MLVIKAKDMTNLVGDLGNHVRNGSTAPGIRVRNLRTDGNSMPPISGVLVASITKDPKKRLRTRNVDKQW